MFDGNVQPTEYWANRKFGKLRMDPPVSVSPGSSTKLVRWLCECGRTVEKKVWWVVNGKVTACGKCNVKDVKFWQSSKFGKLRMKDPVELHPGSSRTVTWICDCGKETVAKANHVTSGSRVSCGKCDWLGPEHWSSRKFGKLKMEFPVEIHQRSETKVSWLCDCGNKTMVSVRRVSEGTTSSCGKCSQMPKAYWASQRFGKLRMKVPESSAPHSDKRLSWACDCGRETSPTVHHVVSGITTSCGKCDWGDIGFWRSWKPGRLFMESPIEIAKRSSRKVWWVCDCGSRVESSINSVFTGNTQSCGECYNRGLNWYSENRDRIRALKVPIFPSDVPRGWTEFLQPVFKVHQRVLAKCGACKSEYGTYWNSIRFGKSLTCGCSSYKVSSPVRQITQLVRGHGLDVINEHCVGGLKYDIFVPSINLLIEFNGLRWHSFPDSKSKDVRKHRTAIQNGFSYICVFEDEWRKKQSRVQTLILNRIGTTVASSVRPSQCEFMSITSFDSDSFYEEHHYIGAVRGRINYGVYDGGRLVACMSFKRPTRQSTHDWELVRMASVPDVRVHGVWSKLLKKFVVENSPKSIVSFSDNRLFSGKVYDAIGFTMDGSVKPDYYWIKGMHRHHKSGLRKKGLERNSGLTETQLREAQGYRKIWDLGKTRWVWRSNV